MHDYLKSKQTDSPLNAERELHMVEEDNYDGVYRADGIWMHSRTQYQLVRHLSPGRRCLTYGTRALSH